MSFLQGLVSNDVAEAAPGRAVWAALLTPQGKWLADFFILADGERLLLDCEARAGRRCSPQRLSPLPAALEGGAARCLDEFAGPRGLGRRADRGRTIAAPDPRLPEAGWRVLAADAAARRRDAGRLGPASAGARPARRLARPGGGKDRAAGGRVRRAERRVLDQGLLHGPGADRAHQVPRPGQAPPGAGDGGQAACRRPAPRCCAAAPRSGTMRSGRDQSGMAVLRLDALRDTLTCGDATLAPHPPAWMALPEAVA